MIIDLASDETWALTDNVNRCLSVQAAATTESCLRGALAQLEVVATEKREIYSAASRQKNLVPLLRVAPYLPSMNRVYVSRLPMWAMFWGHRLRMWSLI